MTGEEIKPRGSHRVTNDVVFNLIKSRITRESTVLDFGAGNGHMSQRVGSAFEEMGEEPDKHLFACEIAPDQFLYSKVACQRISTDSVIPYADDTFDLIYAIEVLEHTPRPYDFFDQAYSKLKQGGWLVFSVPNILHFKSRLKILFTGYGEMYGPLSSDTRNAGRICGHIMPLSYSNFRYGLKKSGFSRIETCTDRRKKGALIAALPFLPFLKYFSARLEKSLREYDSGVWEENRRTVHEMNSLDMLTGRSCIIAAQKG